MAIVPILSVLVVTVVARCKSDLIGGFGHSANSADQFGALLKPPPPPLAPIVPVPFHAGTERTQRHNADVGYQYPTPPPHLRPSNEFKFPAPFYKQYSFNFVPPPQPFTTTPSPTMFQKVSEWLFPSQQTNDAGTEVTLSNIAPIKKDCNPCNLVPWLPVIRYNLGAKPIVQNPSPTYGAPSPTAYANFLKNHSPQYFNIQNQNRPLPPAVPHAVYGPPTSTFYSSSVSLTNPTYGPPSATHTADIASPNPITSTFSQPSSSYGIPSSSFIPSPIVSTQFFTPTPEKFEDHSSAYTTISPQISSGSGYQTPHPLTTTYLPQQNDVEFLDSITPKTELQLPKVTYPTVFRNSYGEPINDTRMFDISYPVSATAAESSKVKTQVLPDDSKNSSPSNTQSFALGNPAPFTPNRGRNIHTLQPVALPNLSVSPLPPIFNARPFRPMPPKFPTTVLQGINHLQQYTNNVNVESSIPIAEYTHSIDYPPTVIQSPIIEVNPPTNHTVKGYRNIPNSYDVDEIRDISSQASEDHISATKSDSSFESTGIDVGNDLYDSGMPSDLKQNSDVSVNHKKHFADLRGMSDDDLDKYRTESNLQHIDSPLLYLKPSAPHKGHGNFILAISSPIPHNEREYEIYDDMPTTTRPSSWEGGKTDYQEQPSAQGNDYKPKIVQIIVPYTTGNQEEELYNDDIVKMTQNWPSTLKDEFVARKVPTNKDTLRWTTENYSTGNTVTTEDTLKVTENYDLDQLSSIDAQKDLYDAKEPPFDIIKLQHTIDDWTEQEYSKQYKTPQKTRSSEKYAKQIPDDYFTTTVPTNYQTTTDDYIYEVYDHEGSSSIQHTVTNESNNHLNKPRKEYNIIERTKNKNVNSNKNEEANDIQKLHIYTAASSFRTSTTTTTSTTTPPPWGKIQTSISPLTKEKVYVVTSKPWSDTKNVSKHWYEPFESMRMNVENSQFHTPRFLERPSFGFTSGGKIETESSYGYSKKWYQTINELETSDENKSIPELEVMDNEDRTSKTSDFDKG